MNEQLSDISKNNIQVIPTETSKFKKYTIFVSLVLGLCILIPLSFFLFRQTFNPVINLQIIGRQSHKRIANVSAELADNKQKQAKGLQGKKYLAVSSGMLFVFDEDKFYEIWTKGISFPVDIIWINNSSVISQITHSTIPPELNIPDKKIPRYRSSTHVNKILLVPSNFAKDHNIAVGDSIKLNLKKFLIF